MPNRTDHLCQKGTTCQQNLFLDFSVFQIIISISSFAQNVMVLACAFAEKQLLFCTWVMKVNYYNFTCCGMFPHTCPKFFSFKNKQSPKGTTDHVAIQKPYEATRNNMLTGGRPRSRKQSHINVRLEACTLHCVIHHIYHHTAPVHDRCGYFLPILCQKQSCLDGLFRLFIAYSTLGSKIIARAAIKAQATFFGNLQSLLAQVVTCIYIHTCPVCGYVSVTCHTIPPTIVLLIYAMRSSACVTMQNSTLHVLHCTVPYCCNTGFSISCKHLCSSVTHSALLTSIIVTVHAKKLS